ncbi:hypothetical protein [Agrobacterium vitis]|uniref:hypothetical protein n=1 Tax=Agrobacterium vitis TaxID=373 RepID=UPI0012E97C91|nr:hypothetical protein [Agrobacterium vitis]MUZ65355.1 hypothetical protein [Agrobacterium vitis]
MPPWKPGEKVDSKELVGRRIFESAHRSPEKSALSPNIYFDTRLAEDLSLDRLGHGQSDKRVLKHITPLADEAGRAQGKVFNGWAATRAGPLSKLAAMKSDPMEAERDGIDNPYHALVDREHYRVREAAYALSRALFFEFQENGEIVAPFRKEAV